MVVGRRGNVRTRRVQPGGGAPLEGDRAASADAAHAAALRLLTTRARTRAELRERLEQRGFDPPAVAAELRDRGVDPAVAERAAEAAVPPESRADRCRQVAEARLASLAGLPAPTRLRRLAAYLARRGYPPDLAETVA